MPQTFRYRHLLASLEDVLFPAALWSPRTMSFAWHNTAFLREFGPALSDLDPVGMPREGFLSDTASAVRMRDAAYLGLPSTDPEYAVIGPRGGTRYWQVAFLPLHAEQTDGFDVLVTAVDVTEAVGQRRESEQDATQATRSLDIVESTLLSSLDAQEILERVLLEATEAMDADWGWVAERDAGEWILLAVHGLPFDAVGRVLDTDPGSLPGLVADSGEVLAVPSQDGADSLVRVMMRSLDLGAFIMVPIRVNGLITRVMGFCWSDQTRFTDAQRELARRLATVLGLAMRNAEEYALERRLRRSLESAFIPRPGLVEGLEIGHLYYSASPDSNVGGDFWELLRLPEDRLGVVVGDAEGSGVEAARTAGLARDLVRRAAYASAEPREVVHRAREELREHAGEGDALTSLVFGVYDPRDLRFGFSALPGSCLPILGRHSSHGVTAAPIGVETGDLLLGAASLSPGDLIVLCTDGITEAHDRSGRAFGLERLRAALERCEADDAAAIPESLFQHVFAHAEGRLRDDAVLVAVRAA